MRPTALRCTKVVDGVDLAAQRPAGAQAEDLLHAFLEVRASGSVYLIKSDKGYWLPDGFGYTSNKAEAGRFSVADMASLNLDGCTLSLFREDKPFGPGKFLGD